MVKDPACVRVKPHDIASGRQLYDHQREALKNMDIINKEQSFSTLIVLPTGGGKTYTATTWLLRNAVDKKKKILWLAHRQLLLDQAAESFKKFAYRESLKNISSFRLRIISGATEHDRLIDIEPDDDILIVSKDSLTRNVNAIDDWLSGENEIYLVIDEAHHSTAKSYRKIINHVKDIVTNVKLLGLTATPTRTAKREKGLLSKIYTDGVENGFPVHEKKGMAYEIGLKQLISNRILSKPHFISFHTDENFGDSLGLDDIENITNLDQLPEYITEQMVNNAHRNKLIVETYKKHQEEYQQTIVFAMNIHHAISLSKLFNKAGIPAGYVVSGIQDYNGHTVTQKDNEKNIQAFKDGNLKVLVNVNILTEGVDIPETKTVFLTRPTTSTILMTQMIGRALRGSRSGGTNEAFIVSFIDNWKEHIGWVNPESLFIGANEFADTEYERLEHEVKLIAISKIEEFASMLDESIDTSALENIDFEERIPIGMYAFKYLDQENVEHFHQVIIYDSTKDAYAMMMGELNELFKEFDAEEFEFLPSELLVNMIEHCKNTYFLGEMIPPYDERDIRQILNFYAQYDAVPDFYTFDAIDKNRLDVSKIAKKIYEEDMGLRTRTEYLDSLWNSTDENILQIFFGKKRYFLDQIQTEELKLTNPEVFREDDNIQYGEKDLEDLPLYEIRKYNPDYEKELREKTFEASKDDKGNYTCAFCGRTSEKRIFEVDHITPLNKGGKSVLDNLQILCRQCNAKKSDNVIE